MFSNPEFDLIKVDSESSLVDGFQRQHELKKLEIELQQLLTCEENQELESQERKDFIEECWKMRVTIARRTNAQRWINSIFCKNNYDNQLYPFH